jgi:2-methylisocitrate lyase-like PEP mutase family enzyme
VTVAFDVVTTAADALRALHLPGHPLVLPNAWDITSARLVEEAGFPAVATSSAAVARSIGSEDHEAMSSEQALDAAKRIIDAVSVPVTVDFEGGYSLPADSVAYGLVQIGAAGCNIEDSDHRNPGLLMDPGVQARRIAAIREAAGDSLVINARVDTFVRGSESPRHEANERGRRYLDAGADCIYPILAADEEDIADMVDALGVVNIMLRKGGPSLARCVELGVARVSVGSGLYGIMTSQVGALLRKMRDGDDSAFREA